MWFKKKSADHALKELVDGLSRALGPRLLSVLLYGSKASGEYREDHSDVNVFILLDDVSGEILNLLSHPIRVWIRAGHPMPVFLRKTELSIYAKSLPIEFLDMQDHHKIIFGSDPLQSFTIDRSYLPAQCAQELSVKLLKLRQAVLLNTGHPKRLRDVLLDSLPSVLTLYRAVLRLEAEVPRGHKILSAKELSKRVGFDGDCLEQIVDFHIQRETDHVEDVAPHYLEGLERVLAYLNRK